MMSMPLWSQFLLILCATPSVHAHSRGPSYWPKYDGDRHVELLDGLWSTSRVGSTENPIPFDSTDPNLDPSSLQTRELETIPSCVDNAPPGELGYRGVSFFRRHFHFDLSKSGARLLFQACSFYCRVWVNGQEIGDHRAGGYVAFSLTIPPQKSTKNEIFVLVDNRFNQTTAPLHLGGDFWHYSGIMRSVELHALPVPQEPWPWRVYAQPDSLTSVELTMHLTERVTRVVDNIWISFDDGLYTEYSGMAVNGILKLGSIEVPNPRIWSTTDPQLHVVNTKLNGAIVRERFGLRIFDIDEASSRIRVNGEILKLVGWNHHTQWPNTAASPTDAQLEDDMRILVEGGANFVRGAHYPQDPRWLDLLDEHGMVMWSETLGPGLKVEHAQDPIFLHYQTQQLNEMLDNAMNHASIAIWAFFNEGKTQFVEACPAYQMSYDVIKSRDKTRFVSYASAAALLDMCFAAADVIAINGYPGWYQKEDPNEYWPTMELNVQGGKMPDCLGKPFLMSETGAGGIFEWSDNTTDAFWTLKYQAEILGEDVDIAISHPGISGIALWHMFDFKVNDKWENHTQCDYIPNKFPPICRSIHVNPGRPSGRPGGLNHKGVIDYWRRPKPSYEIVATKFKAVTGNHTSGNAIATNGARLRGRGNSTISASGRRHHV